MSVPERLRSTAATLVLVMALSASSMLWATPAGAAPRPPVLPPQSHPGGASYGEWNTRWWQWLYQTPVGVNPEFSDAGEPTAPARVDCSAGQSGHVWFIGGTFSPTTATSEVLRSDVYRSCAIPPGKSLFFPLLNVEFDNLACPDTNFTAAELAKAQSFLMNHIVPGSLTATIDGVTVPQLSDYRSPSPRFSYQLPADNIGQFVCESHEPFPVGTQPPPVDGRPGATADGIYLMLTPLSPGTHKIHFGGEFKVLAADNPPPPVGTFDFIQNINYTITVAPR